MNNPQQPSYRIPRRRGLLSRIRVTWILGGFMIVNGVIDIVGQIFFGLPPCNYDCLPFSIYPPSGPVPLTAH